MYEKSTIIKCPIFQTQEGYIQELSDAINKAATSDSRMGKASELMKEVDVLLSCQDYDESSIPCISCRSIASLRNQTSELILKMNGTFLWSKV